MDVGIPPYHDDGALREQDRVPLDAFLGYRDRTQITGRGQPFFSGREAEVNVFREVAKALARGHAGNATLVVEGPPGAGKSALLAQFQEDMRTFPPTAAGGRRWLSVPIEGGAACSPAEIMWAVDNALARQLSETLLAVGGDEAEGASERLLDLIGAPRAGRALAKASAAARRILDRGVSAAGFSIGAKGAVPPGSLRELEARRGPAWGDWQIVLLIDEAQQISDTRGGAVRGTLSAIHQGLVGLPISFCAFGLHGTRDALAEAGVSRVADGRDLRLAGLDARASRMAARRCFAAYGVTRGSAWEDAVVERSANWPQHLAVYLNAALAALQANAPSPDRMGDARRSPLAEALALGDDGRRDYYERRLERLNRGNARHRRYAGALASWMSRSADGLPTDQVIGYLEGPPLHLPTDEADRFLDASQHAGLLGSLPGGRMRMPIPSFAGHLLNEPLPSL